MLRTDLMNTEEKDMYDKLKKSHSDILDKIIELCELNMSSTSVANYITKSNVNKKRRSYREVELIAWFISQFTQ